MLLNANKGELLKEAKESYIDGKPIESFEILKSFAQPSDELNFQLAYSNLASKLQKEIKDLIPIRIAFLGNATLDQWTESLRFWLLIEGFRLEEKIIPFGTWRQSILDVNSELYKFDPDITWFFLQHEDIMLDEKHNLDAEVVKESEVLDQVTGNILEQISIVRDNTSSLIVINNFVSSLHRTMGNYEGSIASSRSMIIQQINIELAKNLPEGSCIFDIAYISNLIGLKTWYDNRLWFHSKHPFSFEVMGEVAFRASHLISASQGRAKKCLILDLDNTLWGGVVGDDGISGIKIGPDGGAIGESFYNFQVWLKSMSNRGIALAISSKNEEKLAKEPFLNKAGMFLKLEDFVSFKANWKNKADNIRDIALEMNLGLESFVFIDDNPAERELVRKELPQVIVPELPKDPSDYIEAIESGSWFETIKLSAEDRLRVRSYQQNSARKKVRASSSDLKSYLLELEMSSNWGTADKLTLPRITQLINKTNQFHLTTTRYSESEISSIMSNEAYWVGHFSLSDKFGDHGLIAVVILRFKDSQAFIDTWTMSCRVFS